ncbi:PRELI-like family-domain-containing protein [Chiua virens]|nr:PRELI-like family-domain-containing protein [Chiua virens]
MPPASIEVPNGDVSSADGEAISLPSTKDSTDQQIELIFLGTGTSSSIPNLHCLTAPASKKPCRTCLSTLTPEGKKNIRRNTSAVVRVTAKDGKKTTLVIDVGKNFHAAAIEWFPKYELREIDAVLITHAHADAMNGLDDLRGWTLGGAIQKHIDVYLSQDTLRGVQRAFPYLVAKEFASGGGDVPEFKWHIIEDKIPFEIEDTGIRITPFLLQHGRLFTPSPQAFTPTPFATHPVPGGSSVTRSAADDMIAGVHPYFCFGFLVQDAIVYMSDVSLIPDDTWPVIQGGQKAVLVIDCLRLRGHMSHMGIGEAAATIRRIRAKRSYMTGFNHDVSHEEYTRIGERVGSWATEGLENDTVRRGVELMRGGLEGEVHWGSSSAMKFFSQSFVYDDPWSIVSLAFFLRYPNPYASHVISCDVVDRRQTDAGSLLTTRLILKRGSLPRWAPQGIISRTDSWVIEESEVDPFGKVVRCRTKNLDHVKVMQIEETQLFHQSQDGRTVQTTEAYITSKFGWGLTKRIESHGLARFKAHVQRSRQGVSLMMDLIRQARLQPMAFGSYISNIRSDMSFLAPESSVPSSTGIDTGHKPDNNHVPTSQNNRWLSRVWGTGN